MGQRWHQVWVAHSTPHFDTPLIVHGNEVSTRDSCFSFTPEGSPASAGAHGAESLHPRCRRGVAG